MKNRTIEVILLQDDKHLGEKYEIIRVKPIFARNVLFPNKIAILADKEAKNNFDFNELGRYFSALSNGANLQGKQYAWLVFGVSDKTHQFVNTNYRKGSDLNNLKNEIIKFTNDNLTF